MKTSLRKAQTSLLAAGLLALAAGLGFGAPSSAPASAAPRATAPQAANAASQNQKPSAPDNWSRPVDIEANPDYDSTPWIASAPDGAVTIGWQVRDQATGTYGAIHQASNTSLGATLSVQELEYISRHNPNGNVRTAADSLGRRWITWFSIGTNVTCDKYAMVDVDGRVHAPYPLNVPNSCVANADGTKNVAMAVGPDNSVYFLFGKDYTNIKFWHLQSNGTWENNGQPESVPVSSNATGPKNISMAVTSLGTVMAAYIDQGPAHNDVFTTVRLSPNHWSDEEDLSAAVCPGFSHSAAHLPFLVGDTTGGIRIAWSQIRCDPYVDPGYDEVYYREWVPGSGWANQPIVRLTENSGSSYQPSVAVDINGLAYVFWADESYNGGPAEICFAQGRTGMNWAVTNSFLRSYFGGNYQKDASVAANPPGLNIPSALHLAFGSNQGAGWKDNWYTWVPLVVTLPPTPTPTNSPTPTASPTPCPPGVYQDVHPTDYFYQAVTALSTENPPVISGYGDCTFRPYNNLTRGQAAKVIVLGAHRAINTTGGPHFTDVPTTDPFYQYIETAYNDGIITGYADHTFRPGNNVTRGQFAKMVVLGYSFGINTTGGPHFTDVLTTNPFYQYIETAYNLQLISGYADHTFRPYNNITRGQAAKIVYLGQVTSTYTPTATGTPGPPSSTPTETGTVTPVVVTATATDTPFVITATPTSTPVVVTATPTGTVPAGR